MERYLIFPLLFATVTTCSQVVLTKDYHDFSTLGRADEGYADFEIDNGSEETVYIFRVEVPKYVDVAFSSKTIPPHGKAYIRLKYNPQRVGAFKEAFKVFTSAWKEPEIITIRGEATFAADRFIPCPDFSETPAGVLRPFSVSARSFDNQPLSDMEVFVFREGRSWGEYHTDINGELNLELPLGKYYFSVGGLDTSLYVSATNDHLVAFFDEEYTKRSQVPLISEEAITPVQPDEPSSSYSELPPDKFKPNNLVFLVDVSTSMKHNGKLELMKVAMIRLVDLLRDLDRFTLISYSSDSGVLLKTDGNLDKEACKRAIAELRAGGKTEGAKALDKAGRAALDYYMEEGNNQIILATDGAFNEGADKARKISSKYHRKGVIVSVVGIKCGKFASGEMTELADIGGGSFIPLNTVEDANDILLKEVKLRSAK